MAQCFVIVRLAGGLGNQMFQYALGLALTATGNRKLYVDRTMVDRDPLRSYALNLFCADPPHVPWSLQRGAISILSRTRLWSLQGRRWGCLIPFGPRLIRERSGSFDPSVLRIEGNIVLDGYWQSEEYFVRHQDLVRTALTWRDHPTEEEQAWLSKADECDSVAVHVRRGDYVTNPAATAFHGLCGESYYLQAATIMAQRLCNPRFFVVSDDPDWAEKRLSLPGPVEVVRLNGVARSHMDMRIISRCKHAIIANSSFSWWGAWLSEYVGKIIVAPIPWIAQRHWNLDPVPSRWLRVPL